jgi:addiction module HigA family antidote
MTKKRKPTHPGIILEEHYIKRLPITLQELSEVSGISRNTLYKIRSGNARITANIALRLSKALNTTPELWLNLQQKYDIWKAEHDKCISSLNIQPIVNVPAYAKKY